MSQNRIISICQRTINIFNCAQEGASLGSEFFPGHTSPTHEKSTSDASSPSLKPVYWPFSLGYFSRITLTTQEGITLSYSSTQSGIDKPAKLSIGGTSQGSQIIAAKLFSAKTQVILNKKEKSSFNKYNRGRWYTVGKIFFKTTPFLRPHKDTCQTSPPQATLSKSKTFLPQLKWPLPNKASNRTEIRTLKLPIRN